MEAGVKFILKSDTTYETTCTSEARLVVSKYLVRWALRKFLQYSVEYLVEK